MSMLHFLEELENKAIPFRRLKDLENHDIPLMPGVYILAAEGRTRFNYPCGLSPIYYIGQSMSLRRRLDEHRVYSKEARENRKLSLYYPRYEYAATFGARYTYICTWQGMTPKSLEDLILSRFAHTYYSFPVANGMGAWNKIDWDNIEHG